MNISGRCLARYVSACPCKIPTSPKQLYVHLLLGIRTATVLMLETTRDEILGSKRGQTRVNGPGQYFFANTLALESRNAIFFISSIVDASTGRGLLVFLFLITKTRLTANWLYGSQPIA